MRSHGAVFFYRIDEIRDGSFDAQRYRERPERRDRSHHTLERDV